jgi:hypothetical protein
LGARKGRQLQGDAIIRKMQYERQHRPTTLPFRSVTNEKKAFISTTKCPWVLMSIHEYWWMLMNVDEC